MPAIITHHLFGEDAARELPNDILEGDALVNDRTGEVLARHPNTRVIITDNTAPGGDATDYLARNDQDASVIDRCWHIRLNYPDAAAEAAMLEAKLRPYTDSFGPFEAKAVRAAVRFARKSRESASLKCSHPVSCRVLERFLGILFRMNCRNAVRPCIRTERQKAALIFLHPD